MAITSTGNTKISGTIGSGNALDGVSINGNASTISLNDSDSVVGSAIGSVGADTIRATLEYNLQNNINRIVIPSGKTVSFNGNLELVEGAGIIIQPYSTLNIGGFSFKAGDEAITYTHSTITYTHSSVNKYQMYGSCKIDDLLGDHNDDDHDSSGFGMMVMGDEALPLVDAIGC